LFGGDGGAFVEMMTGWVFALEISDSTALEVDALLRA